MKRSLLVCSFILLPLIGFSQAANDECVDLISVVVPVGSTVVVNYDTREATESTDSSCNNASQSNHDLWYDFVMPVDGNLRVTSIDGTDNITIYDSCGGTEIACFYNDGFVYGLTSGVTYILRFAERSVFANAGDFAMEAFPTALNDDCSEAILIGVGVIAPTSYTTDTRTATESLDASCNTVSQENLDVWYEFVMPVDGNIEISGVSNVLNSTLYDGCGGLEISCFYNDGVFFGLSSGTTYFLRIAERSIFSGIVNFNIQAIEAVLPACADTTEFVGGAWDNGDPNNTKNAIIRSNYNTSTVGLGSITACSCSIDSGNTLTIAQGDFLDVSFGITVNGTLNVEHEASVVQRDLASSTVNSGNINVMVTTPFLKPRDFMIMGSPMDAETRNGVFNNAYRVLNHITGNFIPHPDVAIDFPDAENFADDNNDNWALYPGPGIINPGEGFGVRPQSSNTDGDTTYDLTYSQGTLNNGDITFDVLFNTTKNDSPNLLANPYPSPIWAGDFISLNTMIDEVFFWEHITSPSTDFPGANSRNFSMEDISMYNLMGGNKAANDAVGTTKPNGYISTAQGFGIKATVAGMATFSNKMRRVDNNKTLREMEITNDRLWLSLKAEKYRMNATTLIGFSEAATSELDSGYDSRRLATILSLFSHLEDGSEELGIQSREGFDDGIKVSLGFSSFIDEELEYTISINDIDGNHMKQAIVYLIDNEENTMTNLSKESYAFIAGMGTYSNRFTLQFEQRRTVGSSESDLNKIAIFPNPVQNQVYIANPRDSQLNWIELYDLSGRLVKKVNLQDMDSEISIDISELATASYLMVIRSDDGVLTKQMIKE